VAPAWVGFMSRCLARALVFQVSRVAANWLGDYMGSAVHDGMLYVAYPKNPAGPSHVWFAKVPIQ
jgi:hypothetical protein